MTLAKDDRLLKLGKVIALILQAGCVLGGGIFLALIVFVALLSAGMLPGPFDANSFPDVAKIPLLSACIGLTITANFAGMIPCIIPIGFYKKK